MTTLPASVKWAVWQRFLFRFFFIYWMLNIAPWTWFSVIPGIDWLMNFYNIAGDWIVNSFNKYLFHIKDELVPLNGSGDTSYGWAQLYAYLILSLLAAIIWSLLDRKKQQYVKLNYWLCLMVRYNIALVCFSYGFIKIFNLQMPFPSYSQLATPLGDLLPMRFSWLFMGYSHLYQGFSGTLEVLAGLLLLYRRTTTLGSMVAAGVFLNVAMLNLSYDIPVKIFSIQLFAMCLFLLVIEYRRLLDFFVLNKTAAPSVLYIYTPSKKWMRISKTVMKLAMVFLFVGFTFYETVNRYNETAAARAMPPLQAGLYDITSFTVNKDTLPPLSTDSLRWQNIAIETYGGGSVSGNDTLLRPNYNRSYFMYDADTLKHVINFKRSGSAAIPAYSFSYSLIDRNTINLWGLRGKDSLFITMKKSTRHFQLTEKQFHWLSEYNR
jgi:uncharacterized membrane protein YphA (DoxX/SURF4 family)